VEFHISSDESFGHSPKLISSAVYDKLDVPDKAKLLEQESSKPSHGQDKPIILSPKIPGLASKPAFLPMVSDEPLMVSPINFNAVHSS
jgi:hypothetical protein